MILAASAFASLTKVLHNARHDGVAHVGEVAVVSFAFPSGFVVKAVQEGTNIGINALLHSSRVTDDIVGDTRTLRLEAAAQAVSAL